MTMGRSLSSTMTLTYVISFIDMIAAAMISTLFAIFLKEEVGLSATTSGIIGSLYGSVQFVSCPIAGGESDLHGYRKVLVFCLVACVPAYMLLSSQSLVLIIVARVGAGMFKHTQNLLKTVIGANIPLDEQLAAFSMLNATSNAGFIVGPALAGFVADRYGYGFAFWLIGACFGVNAFLTFAFFPADVPGTYVDTAPNVLHPKRQSSSSHSLVSLLKELHFSKFWDVLVAKLLLACAVLITRSNTNWFLQDKFEADRAFIGYFTSFQGLISLFASFGTSSVARLFPDIIAFYGLCSFLSAASMFAMVYAQSLEACMVAITVLCVTMTFLRPLSYEVATVRCSRKEVGLVLGINSSLVSAVRALSPAISGALHDSNMHLPALVSAWLSIVGGVFAFKCVRPAHYQHIYARLARSDGS